MNISDEHSNLQIRYNELLERSARQTRRIKQIESQRNGRGTEIATLKVRIRELEAALLSTEHLDVQSVLAFEAGKRAALLGMAEWCDNRVDYYTQMADVSAECRRRAEEGP